MFAFHLCYKNLSVISDFEEQPTLSSLLVFNKSALTVSKFKTLGRFLFSFQSLSWPPIITYFNCFKKCFFLHVYQVIEAEPTLQGLCWERNSVPLLYMCRHKIFNCVCKKGFAWYHLGLTEVKVDSCTGTLSSDIRREGENVAPFF